MSIKVRISGVPRALTFISSKEIGIKKGISNGMVEGGNLLKNEVKESVAGNRPEPRSIKTGEFFRSIELGTTKNSIRVFSDVPQAKWMEYGTSRGIQERRHFRNSMERTKRKISNILNKEIKSKIK